MGILVSSVQRGTTDMSYKVVFQNGIWVTITTCDRCKALVSERVILSSLVEEQCHKCGAPIHYEIKEPKLLHKMAMNRQAQYTSQRGNPQKQGPNAKIVNSFGSMYEAFIGAGLGGAGLGAARGMMVGAAACNAQGTQGEPVAQTPFDEFCLAIICFVKGLKVGEDPYDGDMTELLSEVFNGLIDKMRSPENALDAPGSTKKDVDVNDKGTLELIDNITSFVIALCRNNEGYIHRMSGEDQKSLTHLFEYCLNVRHGNLSKKEIDKGLRIWPLLTNVGA